MRYKSTMLLGLLSLFTLFLLACAEATPTPTSPVGTSFDGVPGIVDPTNIGWPREVEGYNGRVVIAAKPERIISASIGHDEVTYALVPFERVVGVDPFSKNQIYSNVADLVQDVAEISREPEVLLARNPDVIVTSIFFDSETVDALSGVGISVVQAELKSDPEGQINNILLMGYIYGEEERAVALAQEVRARYDALQAIVSPKPEGSRLTVLPIVSFADQLYTAGAGSTEGGVIGAAGGINAAAEAGLEGNPAISLESIIAMNPEVIIITQPSDSGEPVKESLLTNAALAEVPAIRDGRVYVVDPKSYTTLSFWNVRGAEDLARILWPEDLGGVESGGFSLPE